MKDFDVIVIGGGPGGYVAAIRAAQLGKKTALVEHQHLGGICLNWGCIPTKALLKSAHFYQEMKNSQEYGVSAENIKFDLKKMVKRSESISSNLVAGIEALLKKNKVELIQGKAKLVGNQKLDVAGKTFHANNIVIATGARARVIEGFEPNGEDIWSYRHALKPKDLPKSMVIVGSGAIGIEFASFYNALGVNVTVLEACSRILPAEDEEIADRAKKIFESKGIKFETSVTLSKHIKKKTGLEVRYKISDKETVLNSDVILMAVGIVGNVEDLGLEKTKVKVEKDHIVTNEYMMTAQDGIYAIGDVAGPPWLAHKASHEGILVAEKIAGGKVHILNKNNIPGCTYSNPQIASVGLTEKAAKDAGYKIKIGQFPSFANAKSLIMNDKEGLVKTIFDEKTGELLGAHMVGSEVTELIQGFVIAKQMETTELELMESIFPHPTSSEMMHESVLKAYGKQIHI